MDENTLPDWISVKDKNVLLSVRVAPRSSRLEIAGEENDRLKVRLKAPPVDGKANRELIRFLSKILKVPQTKVTICAGENSKFKRICIKGLKPTDILSKVH